MKSSTETSMGENRTGLAREPERQKALLDAAQEFPPSSHGNGNLLAETRQNYMREATPIGSVPIPSGLRNKFKAAGTAVRLLDKPTLLMDKLGERLAFEASGVRLYDALISKFDLDGSFEAGPTLEDLHDLRAEEHRHFLWLKECIEQLGGDPTALTPSADVAAVAAMGVPKVLTDPRTTFVQCLDAILMVELVDNDCWEVLIDLVQQAGENQMAGRFEQALSEEAAHLRKVRAWLAAAHGRDAAYRMLMTH